MKQSTKETFEAIINNACLALTQIADTDESLSKMEANYIRLQIGQIKSVEISERQIKKLNTLLLGIFEGLNN